MPTAIAVPSAAVLLLYYYLSVCYAGDETYTSALPGSYGNMQEPAQYFLRFYV